MIEHEPGFVASDASPQARRQLLIKGALAALAVVALVAVLVMVEGPRQEEPAPTARTVTQTVRGGPAPEAQSMSLAEAATQALRKSTEAAELQSVVMAEQQAMASAALAAPVVREESAEPLGVPALASGPKASARQHEGAGRLVLEQSPPKGAQSVTASSSAGALSKVPSAPLKPAVATIATTSAASSTAAPGAFFVQVGVFTNMGNAEDLREKLKAAGIPTQVETRVQVGPFKNRQDALAAQTKLKSLGLNSGMVVPAKR